MPSKVTLFIIQLLESYVFVMCLALLAGLFWADRLVVITPYTTLLLQIIFLLTSLKLEPRQIFKEAKDIKMVALSNIFMLLVLPAATYIVANLTVPSLAVPLMLLAAMPSGMTSPLLTAVVGGNQGLALVLTVTTSLLAPISIPLVLQFFAGTAVTVGFWAMFVKLIQIIVVPFVIAQGLRHIWHRQLKVTYFTFKPISILLLGFLIAGSVANQASIILEKVGPWFFTQLGVLLIFVAALLVIGYFVAFWRHCQDRLTIAVCLTFMNFTLAIYLAGNYFTDPIVLTSTILVILPWALLLLPFKYIVRKFVCPMR